MKVKFNEKISAKKALLVLSLFSIFTSLLCVILSDFLLPVLVALLAALFCFEQGDKKIFSYVTAACVLAINIVGCLFIRQFLLPWAIYALVLAFLIYWFASQGKSKMECVFIATIASAAFIVISFVIFAMLQCGDASLAAVSKYYSDIIDKLRILFVENTYVIYSEAYARAGITFTHDMLFELFDTIISNVISFIIIGGFVYSGIAFKIFQAITLKYCDDKEYILGWRFTTPSLYAYFYLILTIVSLFTMSSVGVLSICVGNLYNVFMVIYAYVGFGFAHAFLSRKRSPVTAYILLLIIVVLFFNFALEILAMIGAFGTIRKNKEITA